MMARTVRRGRPGLCALWAALLLLFSLTAEAVAFHLFRGTENEPVCDCNPSLIPACDQATCCSPAAAPPNTTQPACCPALGEVGDTTVNPAGVAATVDLLHNSFNDSVTKLPVVVIPAGKAVRWRWTSSHCHSVMADDNSFDSGFFYPADPPEDQSKLIQGFFDYPLPDDSPALTYTRVFTTPGVYPYHCVHHQIIGMEGVVIVTESTGLPY